MHSELITIDDMKDILPLQPEGWSDLETSFKFYIENKKCMPFKYMMGGDLVGTGAIIFYGSSAWLAHIIVVKKYRNQGLGQKVVLHLVDQAKKQNVESVLLIATELGYPVYLRTGFTTQSDYLFFERNESAEFLVDNKEISNHINLYDSKFEKDLYTLDYQISGECRKWLLKQHLEKAYLYIKKGQLMGFYLTSLGEGLIMGKTQEAGIGLLKIKCKAAKKVVLPRENTAGRAYLMENGFSQQLSVARMIWGKSIPFKPKQLYNRIAGKLG